MNTKETLKRLHKKFPMMGLDELFEVLDCFVEYSPKKTPWYTTGINEQIFKVHDDANTIPGSLSCQLTADH